MPELPEVETVRRDVARAYLGHNLERIIVTGRRTVRRHPPELLAVLDGRTLTATGRHGKYLLLEWDDGQVLVVHLRMSGQLLAAQADDSLLPHTHAVMAFDDAGELRFVDPRTFGEFFLATPGPVNGQTAGEAGANVPLAASRLAELDHLGPTPSTSTWPGSVSPSLAAALLSRPFWSTRGSSQVSAISTPMRFCFDARVRPERPGGSLKRKELERLTESTHSVLQSAIAARGSSLADEQYRDLQGAPGLFQLEHKVYGRQGQKCAICGREIERVHFGAKSAFLCRKCQK